MVKVLQQNAGDWVLDQHGKSQASSLMFKRLAFTHEKEIRVVYHNDKCSPADKVYKYLIEPNIYFEEIVVDPRIPKDLYLKIKQKIRKAGFTNRIIQSGLYKIEKFTFNAKLP